MKVCVFASGSSGNCLLLSGGGTNILIDAGISMRRIIGGLAQMDLTMRDIGGVLITHEHSDHISGLKVLLKHHDVQLYAPHTVANRLCGSLPEAESAMHIIPVGEEFSIAGLRIRAFHTPHDTDESVGYHVAGDGAVYAHATDMGMVTDEVLDGLCGADTVLIEANHDEDMLRYGPYPYHLKRRILSDHGHLSNENCASLARTLADKGTKRIVLGHLSRENNTPARAMYAAEQALSGTDAELYFAPILGCLQLEVKREEPCLR